MRCHNSQICWHVFLLYDTLSFCFDLTPQVSCDALLTYLPTSVLIKVFGSVLLERRLIFCAQKLRYANKLLLSRNQVYYYLQLI